MRQRRLESPRADHAPQLRGGRIPIAALVQTLTVVQYPSFHRAAQALGASPSTDSMYFTGGLRWSRDERCADMIQ